MKTVSFTGHRPSKIGGYNYYNPLRIKVRKALKEQILDLINNYNVDTFISGGALGVDIDAFYIIQDLKLQGYEIKNILAIPFKNQATKWFGNDIEKYNTAIELADKVIYVDKLNDYKIKGYEEEIYYPAKMQKRNEYMIDNSDIVIVVWDGSKGGTGNCIRYAEKLDKKIIRINPSEIKEDY